MAGPELAVGGWFASAIIGRFINKSAAYLGGNSRLHNDAKEMLDNLESKLHQMLAIVEAAEKQQIQNQRLMGWVQRIKDAAYEAEDVLDDFEAKRIREELSSKSKVSSAASSIAKGVKNLILVDDDVKKLKAVLTKLEQLRKDSETFVCILDSECKGKGLASAEREEESLFFPPKQRLFGRDTEQMLILTIILGYEIESLESETISEKGENLVGASSQSDKGIDQNMWGIIRQKLSKLFGKNTGEVGGESSQEITTGVEEPFSLEQGTGGGPESNPMSSGGGKAESSKVQSGLTSGLKNIEPKSSQDKTQKLLLDLDPTGHCGRPFVIPIVGICGVGKTALARTIYDHPLLKGYFHITIWVYVSRGFNIRNIVEAFRRRCPLKEGIYDLEYEFRNGVEGQRFLLVLDDLVVDDVVKDDVCIKDFIDVRSQLSDLLSWSKVGAYGSVILITTRQNNIADILGTIGPIKLDPLERNDFLPLLEYYAFQNVDLVGAKKDALKEKCRVIGTHLPGIPQVGKIMGIMLRWNMDVELKSILCNNIEVLSFLQIAYEHLDSNLKQCFAFCSSFPTDYIIQRDRIIQMWIANNFIQLNSSSKRKPEDEGNIWFNKLVNFSFFVPTPWPDMYTMNRALRELTLARSSNEFFYSDHPNPCPYGCFHLNELVNQCSHGYSYNYDAAITIPPSTRHLTVRTNKPAIDLTICSDKLRALLFLSDYNEWSVIEQKMRDSGLFRGFMKKPSSRLISFDGFLESASKLRILDLSVGLHINAIGQLSHLRFLDLSYSGINEFPDSLCTLCHLQVLNVRGCQFKSLPKHMNHLINLRHLYASNETISLISGIGKLINLQELQEFTITDEKGHTIGELAELKEIGGHLSIANLAKIKDEAEAQKARLAEKNHLKALSLRCSSHDKNILNSLKPHSNLEELNIINYCGSKLPSWITALGNIRCIYLEDCTIADLPPLGQLPSLHTLHLKGLNTTNIGAEFYGANQEIFPSLKILKFHEMTNWTIWSTVEGRELFPCLEVLQIQNCYCLRETPLASLELSNLKELELNHCHRIRNGEGILRRRLPMLTSLNLDGFRDVTIPVHHVPNLKTLSIRDVGKVSFEGGTGSLSNLKTLYSPVTPVIVDLSLPSLKVLNVSTERFSGSPLSLEQWLMKLSGLVELTIDCSYLRESPSNFANLVSLRTLTLIFSRSETFLLRGGMPPNLKELYISRASEELTQRCSPDQGEDWHKISHIPYIRVNGETLQML